MYWTELEYDILGRVVRTNLPGISNDITVVYNGLTTTTTNPKFQTKTETNNALGELVEVKQTLDGTDVKLTYGYDAQGNLITTTNHGNGDVSPSTVRMCYDLLGRKTGMRDPDKGGFDPEADNTCPSVPANDSDLTAKAGWWLYRYNVFGELTQQLDAKAQRTTQTYDRLGRMTTRMDQRADGTTEGQTTWVYDTAANGLGQLHQVNDSISGYAMTYRYDTLGRPRATRTQLVSPQITHKQDREHITHTTYDLYGRVLQQFDASGDGQWTDTQFTASTHGGTVNVYNQFGYLEAVNDNTQLNGSPKHTYYRVIDTDAFGNITESLQGNAVINRKYYHPATGRLRTLTAESIGILDSIQKQTYQWDDLNNLDYRQDNSGNKQLTESFEYDDLNRLTSSRVTNQATNQTDNGITQTLQYNSIGNIIEKSDVGEYRYSDQCTTGYGPHALCETVDHTGVITTYHYDHNGNMLNDSNGRTLTYSTFDKPISITNAQGDHTTAFEYGPNRSRYLRTDTNDDGIQTTLYLGNVEKITQADGTRIIKRYIGDAIVTLTSNNNPSLDPNGSEEIRYLQKDHLGSIDVITNEFGEVIQEMSFDPWGLRRSATLWTPLDLDELIDFDHTITTRGFTGHEMLDEVGLIHMNGRVYDPRLARFLQADPVLQFPDHTQSYNRYSYVLNNPLKYSDPSGYVIPIVVGIVAGALELGAIATAVAVGVASFAQTLILGGSFSDALKAGVVSGVTSFAFSQIGDHFQGVAEANGTAAAAQMAELGMGETVQSLARQFGTKLTASQFATKIMAHGLVGGVMSSIQGGKFGHGFLSAGLTQAASGAISKIGNGSMSIGARIARVSAASIVGGTVTKVTGGKFANGAVTAAFSRAFNDELQHENKEAALRRLRFYAGFAVRGTFTATWDGELVPWMFDATAGLAMNPGLRKTTSGLVSGLEAQIEGLASANYNGNGYGYSFGRGIELGLLWDNAESIAGAKALYVDSFIGGLTVFYSRETNWPIGLLIGGPSIGLSVSRPSPKGYSEGIELINTGSQR